MLLDAPSCAHSKFFCRSKVSMESLNMGQHCFCCSLTHLLHTNKSWSSVIISGLGNKVIAVRKLFSNCTVLNLQRGGYIQGSSSYELSVSACLCVWPPFGLALVPQGWRNLSKAPSWHYWQGSLTKEHRKSLMLLTRADVALKKRLVHAFDSK